MPDDGGISSSLLNMTKRTLRSRQKTLAGACELNTPTASLEDGDAEMALSTRLSNLENTDLAEATVNLNLQQVAYQAALAATARVMQPSLVDFLR